MSNELKSNPIMWSPSEERIHSSQMYKFMRNINKRYKLNLKSYDELHHWSIKSKSQFWEAIWDFFNIIGSKGKMPYIEPLNKMPESKFFPHGKVNYAENMLSGDNVGLAIIFKSEDKIRRELSWQELKVQVASMANFLKKNGISKFYHKNGKLKETGPGYNEAIRYKISAKSGLNLRENPDLKSKKIAKIPYNTVISLKDKPGIKLTVFDTDKKTGITKPIEGEWVKIGAEFYLSPGDEGYAIDQIDPSSVEGYVFDGFIEKEKYLVKKQGLWTYYYESGVIKKESLGGKIINYDIDGDITEIIEGNADYWGRSVKVTFYKNGKAKSIQESDGGGAIFTEIDKNGNKPEGAYFPAFECYFLSKDINVIQDINKVRECVVKSKMEQ